MRYKYKKGQIFGKKLEVPQYILDKVYNRSLSFVEFFVYNLDDKIPISCIQNSDRQIVEKFGIEKSKTLDWELLNKRNRINFRELLMSIEPSVEDVNEKLYELVKDQIRPGDYSSRMKKIYSNRLFELSDNNDEKLSKEMEKFNNGEVSLQEMVHNWDLYKEKDLSYCLLNDKTNINGITDSDLKQFMASYGTVVQLISNNMDIYNFINEFISLASDEEKKEYIKHFTDDILTNIYRAYYDRRPTIELNNEEYKEIFKYSSMEEFLKLFNEYEASKIIIELNTLPQDYVFNMPIPFSTLLNRDVLKVIGTYGLKNIVDFDNECGHFFTKNNCEVLKSMYDLYLNYPKNYNDPNKTTLFKENYIGNGNVIENAYTKEEFYEVIRRMIKYGPNVFTKVPDYRDITGEFRKMNPELFLSDQAPEELQKLFYTKSITPKLFVEHPELIEFFDNTNIACGFLRNMDWIIPLFDDLESIKKSNYYRFKVILSYSKIQDVALQNVFKEYVMELENNIEIEKIEYISEVLSRLSLSNSSEIFRFRKELTTQILKSSNPLESLSKIEDIFIRNNIPTVGKIYSCFEILYPDFQEFDFDNSMISPVLKKSSTMSKKVIVFSDLIKASFGSNNRSVNSYLKNIEIGSKLYESIKNGHVQYDALNEFDQNELITFSKHLATLYNNSMKGKKENEEFLSTGNVLTDILELSKKLSPDGTINYNLSDRVIRMFCGFAGIDTLEQAKEYIQRKVKTADSRNRNAAMSDMVLEQGDLIKGIGDITYLSNILQNGSVSKEYLGSSADSDLTPLDTDISMIMSSDGTISEKMNATDASKYGPIWFVLKNDNRFITTRTTSETLETKRDMSKMEVFYTGALGEGHYGIRTGFASSEINYIVMENYDPRVGLEIAMNGFYIPVANKEGKIVFTPKDYDELRKKMNGLSYYGCVEYRLDESINYENPLITEIENVIKENQEQASIESNLIVSKIAFGLEKLNLSVKRRVDLSLNSVVLFNTGSTSRFTNIPGDSDFDFVMQLDREYYENPEKKQLIIKTIFDSLGGTGDLVGNDIRELKVVLQDKYGKQHELVIDITFMPKTDKTEYASDVCVSDRLNSIKDENMRNRVKANIIFAKKFLKSINAYKPSRKDASQGGMGGIGVENWILQNGGTFVNAAKTFVDAASKSTSFNEFKRIYTLYNFGFNHMAEKRGQYQHDNYIENMNEDGYNKMVKALKEYLKTMEIDQSQINKINR